MTRITAGMAQVTQTLRLALQLASPASDQSGDGALPSGPVPPDRDFYERSLALDMRANWEEVFQALRTIAQPANVATITQEELGKRIGYFEYDLSRNYFEGKVFIGRNGDQLTNSPDEYMAWLKAEVTSETGPGLTVPPDQMREAYAKLQTDEERREFSKRNSISLGTPVVLFEGVGPSETQVDAVPPPADAAPAQAPAIRAYERVLSLLDGGDRRTMRELIRSLEAADWTGSDSLRLSAA